MNSTLLWLARGTNPKSSFELHLKLPRLEHFPTNFKSEYAFVSGLDWLEEFCKYRWLHFTGIKLRPGYCVQVKITKTTCGFRFETVGKAKKLEWV